MHTFLPLSGAASVCGPMLEFGGQRRHWCPGDGEWGDKDAWAPASATECGELQERILQEGCWKAPVSRGMGLARRI